MHVPEAVDGIKRVRARMHFRGQREVPFTDHGRGIHAHWTLEKGDRHARIPAFPWQRAGFAKPRSSGPGTRGSAARYGLT